MTEITLSQFVLSLAAHTDKAADAAVREIQRQDATGYQHWTDCWKAAREALARDRKGTRDGQELQAVAETVADQRKAAYAHAAAGWTQLAPQWDGLKPERLAGRAVQVGDLSVKVPRLNAERHADGTVEVLVVRFNQGRLPLHVIFGVMRVAELAHPTADITFVDVYQRTTYSSRGRDLTAYDLWLEETGNELGHRLDDDQDQSDAA